MPQTSPVCARESSWKGQFASSTTSPSRCGSKPSPAAGLLVAVLPRWGGLVVAAWLLGIIVNLLTLPGYFDVALRDVGLLAGALALALLARDHDRRVRTAA